MSRWRKILLPLGVLALGYAAAVVIRSSGPELPVVTPVEEARVVRVIDAALETVELTVSSQGEVSAEHFIELVSEAKGKIIRTTDAFVTGGYFERGDVLVQIDPTDYELARVRASARVAEAEEDLALEESELELAAKGLFPMREARVASAEARVASAKAELAQAEADLDRTKVRAPFAGRVLFTQADLGQFVTQGQPLGRIYSVGTAEVRLPLTDRQLGLLDNPFSPAIGERKIPILLRADVSGQAAEWKGVLHRIDGAVDPDNRVWYAVARVDDPYNLVEAGTTPPLALGLFVEAQIQGRSVEGVFRLPRSALRNGSDVLIVDDDERLRERRVEVLQTSFDSVLISDGIVAGERVCVSPIDVFVDGLQVEVAEPASSEQVAVN